MNSTGAQGIYTVTGDDRLQATVPTSAYPGHYPRPWLLGESSQPGHAVGTCSTHVERTRLVPPFLLSVVRDGRTALSTGARVGRAGY